MNDARQLAARVVDLLAGFAPCETRRMFGGQGIFHQGLMFALIADDKLYLKADDDNRAAFEVEGCERFGYFRQGREYRLSYYRAPQEFYENPAACRRWARSAFDAALRQPPPKRKRTS